MKVLVIGSGPIKVAEAAEFDYSGSQALKALKEEGVKTVLVNPNIATVQTTKKLADRIYFLPLTFDFVEKVIEKESPDGIMVGFGGQTALTLGVELKKKGVLDKYGIKVLGTPIEGVESALSRSKFRELMKSKGLPVPESARATNANEALEAAESIGYPVMVRVSFNLGGRGSFVSFNREEMKVQIEKAFSQSYIHEVLVEKYLHHWKELEYEVVRDLYGNFAVVACLENLDPMGIHTGDSVVVAPAQTLDNSEYQEMRQKSAKVAEAISLVGECNVQFALDTYSYTHYVIETNPRMSRSSALASKATGYPIAYVSAKLALGYRLYEILNKVSGKTTACFEPSLDYLAIKVPIWNFSKFEGAEGSLGSQMESIGEVLSIGRSFEEALEKSIRMANIDKGLFGKVYNSEMGKDSALAYLKSMRPYWFLYAAKAFKEGATLEEVFSSCGVDRFFLQKIKDMVEFYERLKKGEESMERAKKLGLSDEEIANALHDKASNVTRKRIKEGEVPHIKNIDTLAGEWPSSTSYMYSSFVSNSSEISSNRDSILLIGSGGFNIGVSVEFDWSVVSLLEPLERKGKKAFLLNCNPETVSTDWDVAKRLLIDEPSLEKVLELRKILKFKSVLAFASGQIGNNLSLPLLNEGIGLLGTSGKSIDLAEDRRKFSALLDRLGIRQPEWTTAESIEELAKTVEQIGYPVLIRPSYVLSGSSMRIAKNKEELKMFIDKAKEASYNNSFIVSKFVEGREFELDCAGNKGYVEGVVLEHIEGSGVHSGDATMAIPNIYLKKGEIEEAKEIALALSSELDVKGPFNLQLISSGNKVYVIELNLRASRSMPFSSKSVGVNIVERSIEMMEQESKEEGFRELKPKSFSVKSPQFSWTQIKGAYPCLGPEMRSTGEGAAFGGTFQEALLKSWLTCTPNREPKGHILAYSIDGSVDQSIDVLERKEFAVFSLEGYGKGKGVKKKEAIEKLKSGEIDLVITSGYMKEIDYEIRRTAADFNVPLILDSKLGLELSKSFGEELEVKEYSEYL
ncbi:MAG: carbamoyl-phosphate synthase (glutamine-hydrolyzing) large subunit [Candidatus Micrarchaeaceae archaeon]